MINFTYIHNNPLEWVYPVGYPKVLKTRLFPRGTPVFTRKYDTIILNAGIGAFTNGIATYHVDVNPYEPTKAFCGVEL